MVALLVDGVLVGGMVKPHGKLSQGRGAMTTVRPSCLMRSGISEVADPLSESRPSSAVYRDL